jgi:hypothetical protein
LQQGPRAGKFKTVHRGPSYSSESGVSWLDVGRGACIHHTGNLGDAQPQVRTLAAVVFDAAQAAVRRSRSRTRQAVQCSRRGGAVSRAGGLPGTQARFDGDIELA